MTLVGGPSPIESMSSSSSNIFLAIFDSLSCAALFSRTFPDRSVAVVANVRHDDCEPYDEIEDHDGDRRSGRLS